MTINSINSDNTTIETYVVEEQTNQTQSSTATSETTEEQTTTTVELKVDDIYADYLKNKLGMELVTARNVK
jgi:hypothetical protein